jgi:hypothetical protein
MDLALEEEVREDSPPPATPPPPSLRRPPPRPAAAAAATAADDRTYADPTHAIPGARRRTPRNWTPSSFAELPETLDPTATSEADRIVSLVVDAKRTLTTLSRLHRLMLILWIPLGLFCYAPSFEARWRGKMFGMLEASGLLQNLWGVCLLMLVAMRHDFPMNIVAIFFSAMFFGVVIGTHSSSFLRCGPGALE